MGHAKRSEIARLPAIVALAAFTLTSHHTTAQETLVPKSRSEVRLSFAPVVKATAPAVVNVYVQRRVQVRRSPFFDDPFFRRFFGDEFGAPNERVQNSLGSGVIVSPDGIVVTNYHVIRGGGEVGIKVALADSREYEARLILQDERTDLAVLRIEDAETEFPHLTFADSDALAVGDLVLAIGNPFGVGQTVTSGIVSALARTRVGISDYQFFIQTDAAINPGNSGGALVDMGGHLVGINTAIFSRSGGSQGVGFAIPANMVRLVVDSAIRGGKVERPWLGAELQPLTSDLAQALGLDRPVGALVTGVIPDSPAAQSGLRPRDVIVRVDGVEVADPQAALYRLTTKGVGREARLEVIRDGGRRELTIALIPPPEIPPRDTRNLVGDHPLSGATVANLSPAVAEELSITAVSGVVVLETEGYSPARRLGLRPGDIIHRLNRTEVTSVSQLAELLAQGRRGWRLTIRRGDEELSAIVRG